MVRPHGASPEIAVGLTVADKMMKSEHLSILYIGTLPPHPGGTAVAGRQLLTLLAKMGNRVTALTPYDFKSANQEDFFARAHPEIDLHRYPVPFFDIHPTCRLTPADYRSREGEEIQSRFDGLVETCRPDIIVLGRESFLWHVPEQRNRPALPCFLIVHAVTADMERPRLVRVLRRQWQRVQCRVAVAENLAQRLSRLGLEQAQVINNGVDLDQFRPQPRDRGLAERLGIDSEDVVIAHFSNLKPLKRVTDIAVSAAQALQTNAKLKYVIVGDGPCRGRLERVCRNLNVLERFRFTGWVDHARLPRYYNLADIVLMPSEIESQSFVYLESQACGRVLLASDIAAAREVVRDGETGLLFRKSDTDDLTAKTLWAAQCPERRRRLGRKARRWVKRYDLRETASRYLSLMRETIQANQGTHA